MNNEDLMNLIEGINRFREEMAIRREKRFWRNKYSNLSLKSNLAVLYKNELEEIKRELRIPLSSKLNKDELRDKLESSMLQYIPEYLLSFTKKNLHFIRKLLNNNGIIPYYKNDNLVINHLREAGIVYPVIKDDKKTVILPTEIGSVILEHLNEDLEKKINDNDEIIEATYGLLSAYGMISLSQLYEIFTKKYEKEISLYEFKTLILYECFQSDFLTVYEDCVLIKPFFTQEVEELQEKYNSISLEYKDISLYQAKRLNRQPYSISAQASRLSELFSTYFEIDEGNYESYFRELVFKMRFGLDFTDCTAHLNRHFSFTEKLKPSLEGFLTDLYEEYLGTPMAALKGYTINEVKDNPNIKIPEVNITKCLNLMCYRK